MTHTYEHPRPALTVDSVIFGLEQGQLQVLLIERRHEPFRGCWALPGGFFDLDDASAEQAALRELREETGLEGLVMEHLGVYSEKDRDPRERVVSLAFYTVVSCSDQQPKAGDDAQAVRWFAISTLPKLAFDHARIIQDALERVPSPSSALETFRARRANSIACD